MIKEFYSKMVHPKDGHKNRNEFFIKNNQTYGISPNDVPEILQYLKSVQPNVNSLKDEVLTRCQKKAVEIYKEIDAFAEKEKLEFKQDVEDFKVLVGQIKKSESEKDLSYQTSRLMKDMMVLSTDLISYIDKKPIDKKPIDKKPVAVKQEINKEAGEFLERLLNEIEKLKTFQEENFKNLNDKIEKINTTVNTLSTQGKEYMTEEPVSLGKGLRMFGTSKE